MWIIAAASSSGRNFTRLGRLVTIASFLLCLLLLYALTLRPWRAGTAAALAMFWFSAAQGIQFLEVGSIVADFVLTACVLFYFILLLDALRQNKPAHWIRLAATDGLAFLAYAIGTVRFTGAGAMALAIESQGMAPRLGISRRR